MNLLILGGTIFLGRYLVESALARGHRVTLFNRGQHSPELYPAVEKLRGDRDGALGALRGRRWDAVVDTSATCRVSCVPRPRCWRMPSSTTPSSRASRSTRISGAWGWMKAR